MSPSPNDACLLAVCQRNLVLVHRKYPERALGVPVIPSSQPGERLSLPQLSRPHVWQRLQDRQVNKINHQHQSSIINHHQSSILIHPSSTSIIIIISHSRHHLTHRSYNFSCHLRSVSNDKLCPVCSCVAEVCCN